MFLLIDNYDSFTFNLAQAFAQLGQTPFVIKNDDPVLPVLAEDPALVGVCLSPGPGRPEGAGACLSFLERLPVTVPVLGVCLGHQILGHFAGARVEVANRVMHGKQSRITHEGTGLFSGLPQDMPVGRYHSLLVRAEDRPEILRVTARTEENEVMGIAYADRPWIGVQFHPESVLTPDGMRLLANFLRIFIHGEASAEQRGGEESAAPRGPVQVAAVIEELAQGHDIPADVANEIFGRLMNGELTPTQAGAFLLGLRAKGESPVEVGAAVNAVLDRAVPVPPVAGPVIDVVGTGGDCKFSFNCSTATALTLAGMGHKVLKHGNRSVSSSSGSADVLEQLGIPLDTEPADIPAKLEKDKFVFLFAPKYHPSFKHVMPIRRELGVRTLFNLLGPLVNPARPTHHLLGVPKREMLSLVAETLARDGSATGAVVCGAGGYDEVTPLGAASVIFVDKERTTEAELVPADYGIPSCTEEELAVSDPENAARILRDVLRGEGPKPMRDMVVLNVGLALYLLDGSPRVVDGRGFDAALMTRSMDAAKRAVDAGAGRRFADA